MRCVFGVLFACAAFTALWAQAENGAQNTEPAPPVYLLRLERAAYLESVCVLLTGSGQYHLERHAPHKVRVFEGSIDADELRSIVQILSGDRLYHLEQKQIPDLMMKSDNDHVVLEIHRPGWWQQLMFPDSASREPFRYAMDPLLKWFETVNKRKMHELSEEAGRNNCLPPSRPEFSQRSSPKEQQPAAAGTVTGTVAGGTAPAAVAPAPDYALQMFDNRRADSRTEAMCIIVFNSGAYHLVKQSKSYRGELNSAVLDGTLQAPELASLRTILDAPDLLQQPEEKQNVEVIFTEGSYFTRLAIPRARTVQKIQAWKAYVLVRNTMSRSIEDHGNKPLAPLREWVKAHIDQKSAIPSASPPNPRCSPGE